MPAAQQQVPVVLAVRRVRGALAAVLAALRLLWEPQALAGGECREAAEHRVRAGGELADAVVSYALPE